MERYRFSSGKKSALSNFYLCPIKIWGKCFSSSEQAYQYFKALFHSEFDTIRDILSTCNPHEIYAIGHAIPVTRLWKKERVHVMLHILRHKLYQCEIFREELLRSGDKILTEQTRDMFWAVGVSGNGQNTLGVLLHVVKMEWELEMLETKGVNTCN